MVNIEFGVLYQLAESKNIRNRKRLESNNNIRVMSYGHHDIAKLKSPELVQTSITITKLPTGDITNS
jgi:hypothetical protein